MNGEKWTGVFPAVTTQFHEDETVDGAATIAHCEALIDSGVSGIVLLGSLGENQSLDQAEKRRLVGDVVTALGERVPIVSGVAETSTASACRYVRDCTEIGVAGFMVMPAMIYRADREEALAHFRAVGSATSLPWMLYNNPIGYHVDITPHDLDELSGIENLVAVKESSADTRRVTEMRLAVGDRYSIFIGVDDLVLQAAALGIDGWVAGSGIAFPRENQHFWELTRAGRWDEARNFYDWFYPLLKLDTHVKLVQYIKLMVQETGLGKEWVRAPRRVLSGAEREEVLRVIHDGIVNRPALTT
ncbi:MAG: dihydrodipicolinate synthase family protein [Planctomycetota bacterium]